MPDRPGLEDDRLSLRAEQVRQARAALVAAGRRLLRRDGFAPACAGGYRPRRITT